MKPRIVQRPQARQDMLDHYAFISEDSLAAAERFFDAAEEGFRRLAKMPNYRTPEDIGKPSTPRRSHPGL